jgi:tetratricopeptide (TPR) repeat protein
MKQTLLRLALVGVVVLPGMQPLPAQDKEGEAEAVALLRQVQALEKAGKLAEAVKAQERLVEKVKQLFGAQHTSTAVQINNLAVLYQAVGDYAKAEPLYQCSLKIREARLGKDHPDVALALNNLARLYHRMGQYAKAEPLYQRSLKIDEARLGKDHPDVATDLNDLARLYEDMGQYGRAEPLYLRSLKIREARLGKDHPDVATSLNNLGLLYQHLAQYAKAEPLHQRSLKIREAKLVKDHPDVAQSLNYLAGLYQAMGQFAKAEPLYQGSLEILEARLGKDHLDVATSLNNLAALYHRMGQYAKAEPLLKRSLAIHEARLSKDHPDVATALSNLAALHAAREEAAEAGRLFDRARRGARQHLALVLPALSDADKAAFFTNTTARGNLEATLSLALSHKSDADLAAQSASWLLNGKGIDQESLASSILLTRQSTDPALGTLARRLLSVRQQLARLSFATPRTGQEKHHLRQVEERTAQEQELARQMRLTGSKAVSAPWVEQAEIRQALPADAVLIDVAHFDRFDFKGKTGMRWQEARYAAWVTPKVGPVQLVDLGEADKIDLVIKQFRATMKEAPKRIKEQGEEKAEKTLREHLDVLTKLVLAPLLPHIGTTKRWLISPDGNLWLLPWEALTLQDGKYALEEHHISYLTSGRDLLPVPAAKVKASAPLVLADPDFDLDPTKAQAEATRLLGPASEEATRALSGGLRLGRVPRWPASTLGRPRTSRRASPPGGRAWASSAGARTPGGRCGSCSGCRWKHTSAAPEWCCSRPTGPWRSCRSRPCPAPGRAPACWRRSPWPSCPCRSCCPSCSPRPARAASRAPRCWWSATWTSTRPRALSPWPAAAARRAAR